jgi:hypothetical protein
MAENEAPTITALGPTGPVRYPQTAPATYPASAPTTVQGTYLPVGSATNPAAFEPQEELTTATRNQPSGTDPRYESPPGPQTPERSESPRADLMNRLRTPAVAAVTGGVLLLGVGFGAGFVVGRDHADTGTNTSVQGGPGGMPGGGAGFGNGQGQQGFGGPQGTTGQGTTGQVQPGVDGQTQPGAGTTSTTGLA